MSQPISLTIYCQNVWNKPPVNRTALQKACILAHDADVCLFQEFGPSTIRIHDTALPPMLAPRYAEVPTAAGERNYTPVFYKPDRFALIDSGYLLFEGKNDANSKSVTWAILSERESGVRFGVCSTHFWWRYDSPEDNTQRLANAAALLACIRELEARYGVPVIAGGDLNCGLRASQGEEPWRWLCEPDRLLDARAVAPITTDTMTHHAYPVQDENGLFFDGEQPRRTLDHVFVTAHPHLRVDSFAVDTSQQARATSDHCPLVVKLSLDTV